eukprot:TRINITY_DN7816_c0_g1_i2.p1 TRINITY_DN7816_c0_g1~~TRINITY_DN7816_c0_g1_i2.p1  ORF type:complete len:536 (+),score=71.55 TRINITY_DN7816_c0_g1_i2:79-1686(+)
MGSFFSSENERVEHSSSQSESERSEQSSFSHGKFQECSQRSSRRQAGSSASFYTARSMSTGHEFNGHPPRAYSSAAPLQMSAFSKVDFLLDKCSSNGCRFYGSLSVTTDGPRFCSMCFKLNYPNELPIFTAVGSSSKPNPKPHQPQQPQQTKQQVEAEGDLDEALRWYDAKRLKQAIARAEAADINADKILKAKRFLKIVEADDSLTSCLQVQDADVIEQVITKAEACEAEPAVVEAARVHLHRVRVAKKRVSNDLAVAMHQRDAWKIERACSWMMAAGFDSSCILEAQSVIRGLRTHQLNALIEHSEGCVAIGLTCEAADELELAQMWAERAGVDEALLDIARNRVKLFRGVAGQKRLMQKTLVQYVDDGWAALRELLHLVLELRRGLVTKCQQRDPAKAFCKGLAICRADVDEHASAPTGQFVARADLALQLLDRARSIASGDVERLSARVKYVVVATLLEAASVHLVRIEVALEGFCSTKRCFASLRKRSHSQCQKAIASIGPLNLRARMLMVLPSLQLAGDDIQNTLFAYV